MVATNKTWLLCTFLFGLHQISQYVLVWKIPFLDSYFDPFLGMICLLGLILQERRFFIHLFIDKNRAANYHFSILEITIITLLLAILFEAGFPRWSDRFTKDYWDYLGCFCGAGVFEIFINKQVIKG